MCEATTRLGAAIGEVADRHRDGALASDELVALLAARERLDAVILAGLGTWDRDKIWELDGARSPVAWLVHRAPLTRQEASGLVRTARHVARFDQTAKALDAGDISASHATIAAQAAKHRTQQYRTDEDVILDVARSLDPSGFRQVMQYWTACADDSNGDDKARDEDEGNYLNIAATFGGIGHLDGRFDPVSTKALTDRLDALEPPDPADGPQPPRTLVQRRATALMRLVHGEKAPATTIDVIVDHDTLTGRPPADPRKGCCELLGHGPVSPCVVRTLACDAAIGRIVLRGESEVLDVGRRTRLITPALRRSLAVRDRACVEPGCDIPAHWCDAHHIIPWQAHGPTSLDNLELRCRRHHLAAHQRLEHEHRQRERRRE